MKLRKIGANQTELVSDRATLLYSYETLVAAHIAGRGAVISGTHYSKTTSGHVAAALKRWGCAKATAEVIPQEELDAIAREHLGGE